LRCGFDRPRTGSQRETQTERGRQGGPRRNCWKSYDANKDGKIDKEERAKMSKEDKEKWGQLSGGHKKGAKKEESKETK